MGIEVVSYICVVLILLSHLRDRAQVSKLTVCLIVRHTAATEDYFAAWYRLECQDNPR